MKKSEKAILLSAVVMIITGGVMSLICLMMGAVWDNGGRYRERSNTIYAPSAYAEELAPIDGGIPAVEQAGEDTYIMEGAFAQGYDREWNFVGQEINSLDLSVGVGEMIVQTGDDFRVEANHFQDGMRCEVRNGTLYVEEDEQGFWEVWNWDNQGQTPLIVVTVPDGTVFEKVKCKVGAGSMVTGEILARSAEIDVDAGVFYGDFLHAGEKLKVDVDAGSAEIYGGGCEGRLTVDVDAGGAMFSDFNASAADFDVDAGGITYSGTLLGDWKADCDVGSVELCLEAEESRYNYVVDNDMGSVSIGGQSFANLSDNAQINNQASFTGRIDCDMGSVTVEFY